jgi:hypothetical protein
VDDLVLWARGSKERNSRGDILRGSARAVPDLCGKAAGASIGEPARKNEPTQKNLLPSFTPG